MKTILILLALVLLPALAHAAGPDGYWLTKKQDVVVQIHPCGAAYCGRIVWLAPDVTQTDTVGKPLCGAQVLFGFKPDPDRTPDLWVDGRIDKLSTGDSYQGQLHLADADTLEVRGYMGVPLVGKTKVLRRVDPAAYTSCAAGR